ncbi:LANO_0E01750g1_1 [Lachancea nothofagi CBS 11611]|uniref:LANO_0E01750g1_1 n=1 Tax=Lachancea nothofagi CBS 11611 TaxID=1266666 RepID=A0A1G4JQ11_9SACH|nr:LANO_0E01750g1_1 [Lachancea nothofagi CBS 11611]
MTELKELRERKFEDSIKLYSAVLKLIEKLESEHDGFENVEDVQSALSLLKKEIEGKITEVQRLNVQRKTLNAKSSGNENRESQAFNGTQVFCANILNAVRAKTDLKPGISLYELENSVSRELSQLLQGVSLVDQQKFKEYEFKIEQLHRENKQLTSQINKLKERWDSLVESARLKRNLQHE